MNTVEVNVIPRGAYIAGRTLALSLVGLALLWLLTIRVPTAIWIGSFTLNAYFTGIAALIAGLLASYTLMLFVLRRPPQGIPLAQHAGPVLIASLSGIPLLLYSVVALGLNFRIEGFQNTLVWAAFSLTLLALPYWISARDQASLGRALNVVIIVVPTTKIVSFFGGFDFYGEASYALVAVVLLAYAVAKTPRTWFDPLIPWLLLISILLCDVRTAAVVAGLLLVFTIVHINTAPWIKVLLGLGVSLGAAALIGLFVGDRFINRGDAGLAQFVGDDSILAGIGTTNRAAAWAFILENLPDGTNWWGQGAGHSSYLADELLGIHHPHNEYLRIFFDFGWVGLGLFLGGSLALFIALVRNWASSKSDLALAAVLVVPAVALLAVTDNPIVFVYVMVPVAIMVAAGLSLRPKATPFPRA